jgi:transcriptional regulator with XRE-family HTH domain
MRKKSYETRKKPAPLSPDGLRLLLHEGPRPVGDARALAVLGVDRSTLSRWLSGRVKVPHAAALVLRQLAEGVPPGCTDAWLGFSWDGDALVTPTGERLTARSLDGLHWQRQYTRSLERRVDELEKMVESLRRVGGSANDAIVSAPRLVKT